MGSRVRPTARLEVVVTVPDGGRRPAGLAAWIAAIAPAAARGELTIALVSDRRMRTLNRTFRGIDRATDVLSFPSFAAHRTTAAPEGKPSGGRFRARSHDRSGDLAARSNGETLGDIAIATGVAARQAAEAGHSFATECRVLALHGLLHVLGYDHDVDGGRMARLEARLRRRGGLRAGLIGRVAPKPGRSGTSAPRTRRRT